MIRFRINDEGEVQAVPDADVDGALWAKICHYWVPGDFSSLRTGYFNISVEEFADKASWLQHAWVNYGHEVDISSEVVLSVKSTQAGVEHFRRLSTLETDRHFGQNVFVPDLKDDFDLTPEQHENVLCLLDMKNGANFSVPGSGKTLTTLALWKILQNDASVAALVVVCPRSAFEAWRSDLNVFFGQGDAVEQYQGYPLASETLLVLVNYEQLENPLKLAYLKAWASRNNAMLVLDEAHRVKGGPSSVRWRAAKSLSSSAVRTDLLTGTPMPQSPADLESLYAIAWPNLPRRVLDSKSLVRLSRKTAFVRTTKDELRIPEAQIQVVSEPASPLQEMVLTALMDQYGGSLGLSIADRKNLARRGKAVMSLLAAATNPGLLSKKSFDEVEFGFSWPPQDLTENRNLMELVSQFNHHEMPWKFKYVALRAEELRRQGKKLLVWTSFVGNIAGLKRVLRSFNPAVVYGGTDLVSRESEILRFRNDPKCGVLISNPQTLGEGISLHKECNVEIFVDRTYNAGLYLQAVDRIHRLGLEPGQETLIEILQTRGSIDERVHSRLESKIRALADFLQDPHLVLASLPQDDALEAVDVLGISDDDFDDLMGKNH